MDTDNKNNFIEDSFNLDEIQVPKKEKEIKLEKFRKEKKLKNEVKEEILVEEINIPIKEFLTPSPTTEQNQIEKPDPKQDSLEEKKIINIFAIVGVVSVISLFLFITINLVSTMQSNNQTDNNANVPIYSEADITDMLDNNEDQFQNLQTKYNGNTDIVAYVSLFDTYINSPVAMSGDNVYYQDHDLYKNLNIDGAVYLDSTSNIEDFGQNTIIYGRTDIENKQFYDLTLFENQDFYNQNRFINLDTIYNNSVWKIYSYYKIEDDNFYLKNHFEDEEFKTYIVGTKNMSMYPVDIEVTENDKILTLTSQKLDGVRYVLHAKLEKIN